MAACTADRIPCTIPNMSRITLTCHDLLLENFSLRVFRACKNIRFSSLFAAWDVSRETSPAAKSEEKRMFSQARFFMENCKPQNVTCPQSCGHVCSLLFTFELQEGLPAVSDLGQGFLLLKIVQLHV